MPVHETKGGYKYGETGKTYKDKKSAIKQAIAIAYSKAEKKGRKPTQDEIHAEISGNPEKVAMAGQNMIYNAYGLYKQASFDTYSAYGLYKVADADDIYGDSVDEALADPSSYAYQTTQAWNKIKSRIGAKAKQGTELKVGWNPFIRSGTRHFALSKLWRDTRPGDEYTWNPFENLKATYWHPRNWGSLIFGGSGKLDREAGDYIMNERRKQIAQHMAGRNPRLYEKFKADLDQRSANNVEMFESTGKIRGDAYTNPYQETPAPNAPKPQPPPRPNWRVNPALRSTRAGYPTYWNTTPDQRYYSPAGPDLRNTDYQPEEEGRRAIRAQGVAKRNWYNEAGAAV